MIQYLIDHPDKILIPLLETVELTLATLVISVALAAVLTILSVKFPRLGYALIQLFSMIYSIPSLAVFALLIPLTGLGKKTAIIVLVIYNQYLLLRNFVTGINEVDPAVVEAARGIGLTDMQILFKVQVPLAKVALYAGIRLAVVSTIGIAGGQDRRRRTRRNHLHRARTQPDGPADHRRRTGRRALAWLRVPVRFYYRKSVEVQEGSVIK